MNTTGRDLGWRTLAFVLALSTVGLKEGSTQDAPPPVGTGKPPRTPGPPLAPGRFEQADADHDGRISRAEWLAAAPVDREGRLFDRVDADGDGYVSGDEAKVARERAGRALGGDSRLDTQGMTVARDVPYAVREGFDPSLTSLDLFAPAEGEKHPVVIMIHGGGWRMGDKSNGAAAATKSRFFVDHGYVFISINYRLSPAVKHPAHIEDVAAAVDFVHDHVAEYGGDPDMMFVMGHSAGAHLAALVATDEHRLGAHQAPLSILKGMILLDGAGYDVGLAAKTMRGVGDLASMYDDAFGDDPEVWTDASPIHHLAPDKGIPPSLVFFTGRGGPRAKLIESFAKALSDAGAPSEAILTPDQDHAAINREFGTPGDMVTERSIEFLESIRKKIADQKPKRQA